VNFWTGEATAGGRRITVPSPIETLPLMVRAGSIVPFGPDLQYAMEKPADPIELRVYPGADGTFTLYEDEGDSYRYEKGAYATISFSWNDKAKTLAIGARNGEFSGMLKDRIFRVALVTPNQGIGGTPEINAAEIHYNGSAVTATLF
jgi:alpha-D-xyloside xylohydrolase